MTEKISWSDPAREFILRRLAPGAFVFEWGPGRSTVEFARYSQFVVTVEHDDRFYDKVWDLVGGFSNICFHFIQGEGPRDRGYWPVEDCVGMFPGPQSFLDYVKIIQQYPPCFDMVYVDGRARCSCAYYAKNKVRRGGWLFLHDAERERYRPVIDLLQDWHVEQCEDNGRILRGWRRPE